MRKIKILAASPGPSDATSYYRAMGPLATLERQHPDEIEVIQGGQNATDYEWNALRRADILFVQRPSLPVHQQMVENAIAHGMPVWIDYDDDLLAVPRENPCHAQYANLQVQQAIHNSLKLATFVSVSTEKLKEKYSQLNPSCQVIPNALDDTLFKLKDVKPMVERQKIVFWRGSNTHMGDLMAYRQEIIDVAAENPDWKFFFLGYNPWFITDHMKQGQSGVAPWASHIKYFNLIQDLQPQILMVPLKKDEFNEAKSHIAWLEGTLAGAAVLGPRFQEWERPGVCTYDDAESFKHNLQAMIELEERRGEWREASREHIERNYLLTDVNQLRYSAAKNLASVGRFVPKLSKVD